MLNETEEDYPKLKSWVNSKYCNIAVSVFTYFNSNNGSGIYYIEYSLQNPGESRRHLYSAIGMATNGWYNRLYTVTGQVCWTHHAIIA